MKSPYSILISNDDGIYSKGIRFLATALYRKGFEITVIAPRTQRSGEGKSVTFDQPIRMEPIPLSYLNGKIGWRTTGTPADAVIHGIYQRSNGGASPYDLIVAGINSGDNTSVHSILTSGTCAVCFEAALLGYPGIAFSISAEEHYFFDDSAEPLGLSIASEIACGIVEKVLSHGMPEGIGFLNVNFPDTVKKDTPIEINRMALTKYRDYTIKREDPRGVPYYWIWGDNLDVPEDTDAYAVLKKKVISITPVTLFFDGRSIPNIEISLEFLLK